LRLSMPAVNDSIGVIARASADGKNGYVIRQSGATFSIGKLVNGVFSDLFPVSFTLTINTFYQIKAELIGSSLFGKIWQDGTAEPIGWTSRGSDSTYTLPGQFGIRIVLAAAGDVPKVDHFSVDNLVQPQAFVGGYGDFPALAPVGIPMGVRSGRKVVKRF
jgi:hypothetical protein